MITPISLENDVAIIGEQIKKLKEVGADKFHIDIIDGLFADNITVSPADLQQLDLSRFKIDLHLLVDDPVEWIEECVALKPTRIFAQVERMGEIEYYIKALRDYGSVQVGLALGISTPISVLTEKILGDIDGVILMAIEPGFSGKQFQTKVLGKIEELRKKWGGQIVVDGGINPTTYKQVMMAGASEAGANSALWKGDFKTNWNNFVKVENK